ncbi:MAG: thioredoxin family protein [Bacteroidetes bacterium]|nr:thioredoxin family protein [Bacteroidota bacterium]MCW5895278.1 thioredoxin family protein [Bacteroidota bacterium]
MTGIFAILTTLLLLLLAVQLYALWKSKRNTGKRIEGITGPLGEAIARGEKVLAYFFSPTCSQCKKLTPTIDRLRMELPNIFKVDISKDKPTASAFGVMATPTTVIVSEGVIRRVLLGVKMESELRKQML